MSYRAHISTKLKVLMSSLRMVDWTLCLNLIFLELYLKNAIFWYFWYIRKYLLNQMSYRAHISTKLKVLMSYFRMVDWTLCLNLIFLELYLKNAIFLGFLIHSQIYVFDNISGANWAIGLKFAPNSPVNFPLLGFRQA